MAESSRHNLKHPDELEEQKIGLVREGVTEKEFHEIVKDNKDDLRYEGFGGVTENGKLKGTIKGVRSSKRGLNPIDDLSEEEIGLIRNGINDEGLERVVMNNSFGPMDTYRLAQMEKASQPQKLKAKG